MKKNKIIHGVYIENPKCMICDKNIPHEWLDGDYSLLMCDDKQCWEILNKKTKNELYFKIY